MTYKQKGNGIQCVQTRAGHYGEEDLLFGKHLPCMHIFLCLSIWVYLRALEETEYKYHCKMLTKC